ncbi:MAG: hypothetical protein P4M05_28340 [Bradyrhizobium sp.]|nr:hypothetical protein [Bradyrhizobium sp.]
MAREPKPLDPKPTPNARPLDWTDPNPKAKPAIWAVSFRRDVKYQVVEAFDKLAVDLGAVEDRFIHLRDDGNGILTMYVVRKETEGKVLPDISSYALLAQLRKLAQGRPTLVAFNRAARDFWARKPDPVVISMNTLFGNELRRA